MQTESAKSVRCTRQCRLRHRVASRGIPQRIPGSLSIDQIEGDLYHGAGSIWVRLGKIEEKLDHVATKSFIVTIVLTGVVVLSAIVYAILRYL